MDEQRPDRTPSLPVHGVIWRTPYPAVMPRYVLDVDEWFVRYARYNATGPRRECSHRAWHAWVADNGAEAVQDAE